MTKVARCPEDSSHNSFVTSATVVEDWVVDAYGDWQGTVECAEVLHRPSDDNVWTCATCGTQAVFVSEEDSNEPS